MFRKRTKLALGLSALLFVLFFVGVTDFGQKVLRGKIPPNASHFEVDDVYMGAGLAPYVYCLIPGCIFTVIGGCLAIADRVAANVKKH